jgi:hypothetical protein
MVFKLSYAVVSKSGILQISGGSFIAYHVVMDGQEFLIGSPLILRQSSMIIPPQWKRSSKKTTSFLFVPWVPFRKRFSPL